MVKESFADILQEKKRLQEALPHFKKGRFFNPHIHDSKRRLWNIFLWQLGYYNDTAKLAAPPKGFSYPQDELHKTSECSVQWINHSTFLIQVDGIHILTDPIWSKRASPIAFVGPKRKIAPGLALASLPRIDYVFISHNHYDHLDSKAIKQLIHTNPKIVFCVPLGLKKWFLKRGATRLIELDWWESVQFHHTDDFQITFTSVPAQHFSGRRLMDKDKTLWCGWVGEFVLKKKNALHKRLYFAGDTGYNPIDFRQIGDQFGAIDLSIIPIGSYVPKKFMAPVHIGPEEAVLIHQDVHSKLSVASHFGTFRLSEEPTARPAYDLYETLVRTGISHKHFRVPKPGNVIYW